MRRYYYLLSQFLNRPGLVFMTCMVLVGMHIIFDGTLWQIWSLYKSEKVLDGRIIDIQKKNDQITERLKHLSDSSFLEKEARDNFNLVGEQDLIFIFSDEDFAESDENSDGHLTKKEVEK